MEQSYYEVAFKMNSIYSVFYVFCYYNMCFDEGSFYFFDPRTKTRVTFYESALKTIVLTQVNGCVMHTVDLPIRFKDVVAEFKHVSDQDYFRNYTKNVNHAALLLITKVFTNMGISMSLRPCETPIGSLILDFIKENPYGLKID